MTLFKYCGNSALKILKALQIKLSRPADFNDPFELFPQITTSHLGKARLRAIFEDPCHVRRIYGAETGAADVPPKAWTEKYFASIPHRIEISLKTRRANVQALRDNFEAHFANHFRLFCLSRTPSSILMWTHYSEDHKGFVLEFDMNSGTFGQMGSACLHDVVYSENRAKFEVKQDETDFGRSLTDVVRRKAMHWAYEEEVRLMVPLELCPTDFLKIDPRCIKSVIFGHRCSPENIAKVRTLVSNPRLAHVRLLSARTSSSRFAIEIRKYQPPTPDDGSLKI